MVSWYMKVGLIILRLSVVVDFKRCFSVALQVRWRREEESGQSTEVTKIGGGVEVGLGRTSEQPMSSKSIELSATKKEG